MVKMRAMWRAFLFLAFVLAGSVQAEVTALRAKRLLDVRRGVIVSDPILVVDGTTIRGLERAVPKDAKVVDLGDVTLLPGFFDMHTHLTVGMAEGQARPLRMMTASPIDLALQATVNARATLLAGFTSVREAGANDFIDSALKRAIERGALDGPRITPSGYQISPTGGHGDNVGFPPGVFEGGPKQGIGDGVDQILFAVRYQIKHGAEVIKMVATSGVLGEERTATAEQFSDEEFAAIVGEAKRHGLKVMAHAHGLAGILAAVRAGVASIEHGSVLDDEAIRLMKEKGVYLVPTLYVAQPEAGTREGKSDLVRQKGLAMSEAASKSFRAAVAAGVKIAYGTDSGVYPHGQNAREFAVLVAHGMTPLDALRSATIAAADLLGVDDRGVLEAGKLADVIAVRGNPLDDIRTTEDVVFVMKDGAIVKPLRVAP